MSQLKKMKVTIKSYGSKATGDSDALFSRVRLEDEAGNTFYLKHVVVLKYLLRHGAMASNAPVVWYYKNIGKRTIVVIALETAGGKVEYDLEDMRLIVRSSVFKGILISLGLIPGGLIAATATFGLGLVLIPLGLWYGYRNVFVLPSMLRRTTLCSDLEAHGITVR